MPTKTLVKTVDFAEDKPVRVDIPKGNYIPRIEIHLEADITEGAAPVWKDGGITNLIKRVSLVADGKTFNELSGRNHYIKDIFDYRRYQDITPKAEATFFIDLEDENLAEDGILSPLPSMLYNSIVLEILWGNINDVGSDLTLNSAKAHIIVHEIKPDELSEEIIAELEDEGLDEEEIAETLKAVFANIGNQIVRQTEKAIEQSGEVEITLEAGVERTYEKILIIAENNGNLDDNLIEKITVETNEGYIIRNVPFKVSQAQDTKEYQLTQKVKGATVVDIPIEAERYSRIVVKPTIASGVTLTNAKIYVVTQYTEPNKKASAVAEVMKEA